MHPQISTIYSPPAGEVAITRSSTISRPSSLIHRSLTTLAATSAAPSRFNSNTRIVPHATSSTQSAQALVSLLDTESYNTEQLATAVDTFILENDNSNSGPASLDQAGTWKVCLFLFV